jgi:hypothetical protein
MNSPIAPSPDPTTSATDAASRIRALLLARPDLADMLTLAFEQQVARVLRHARSGRPARLLELARAADVLHRGEFVDSSLKLGDPRLVVCVSGFAASKDAGRVVGQSETERSSDTAQALRAIAAVVGRSKTDASTVGGGEKCNTLCTWTVVCRRPAGLTELEDPWTFDPESFACLPTKDQLMRILFWAAGIADRGSLCPWIPRPQSLDLSVEDLIRHDVWERRSQRLSVPCVALEPIPLSPRGVRDQWMDWDDVVLQTLERLLALGQADSPDSSAAVQKGDRRAARSRRDRRARASLRRNIIECGIRDGMSRDEIMQSLAKWRVECSRSTYFADQKKILAGAPNRRSNDVRRIVVGLGNMDPADPKSLQDMD